MAAWDEAPAERNGAIVVEGELIEALHLDVARRILEREPGRS
jgi:citrate lyase beta subunit